MGAGKHGSSEITITVDDAQGGTGRIVTPYVTTLSGIKITAITQIITAFGDTWEKSSPTGVSKAELAQAGAFFDDTTNSLHDAFKAMAATVRVVVLAPTGNTIGKGFVGFQGAYSQAYEVLGKVNALTNANAGYVISGQIDRGVIIQDSTAKTIDWNTKTDGASVDYTLDTSQRNIPITSNTQASPTVVTTPVPHGLTTGQVILIAGNASSNAAINGERTVTVVSATTFSIPVNCTVAGGTGGSFVLSSTVNGAVGYQSISAFSGFTGFVGTLRHSADDSTYADLIVFANVTSGPTAERLTAAGTVNRYLCFDGNVTGSGSITPFAGLKRI